MKTPFALVAFFCSLALSAVAQHPLVGTWNMISVKGVDADGKRFFLDTTSVKETKIITPTHYMQMDCFNCLIPAYFRLGCSGRRGISGE